MPTLDGYEVTKIPEEHGAERQAVIKRQHGFHIRHPPAPHELQDDLTDESQLFQTIHMGAVDVDAEKWLLVIDGLVERPFALNLEQLKKFPRATITSFHECFGSPLAPATKNLWRVGNVQWTGVRLTDLLSIARFSSGAKYVWSEGLDAGTFAGVEADRYQKDLPMYKAQSPEVLVAYEMNGLPLRRERGGPVRLVVPGFFGTNSTKWLCRLSLQAGRAPGPYTTRFYNTPDMESSDGQLVPVWRVDVNSMITRPRPNEELSTDSVNIEGWAWSHDGVSSVDISLDDGQTWQAADLDSRIESSWQRFTLALQLSPGHHHVIARATSKDGQRQQMSERRNHVHRVWFTVLQSDTNRP